MSLRVTLDIISGDFERQAEEHARTVARTSTLAMREVQGDVKSKGRANIAAAGFSRRWQNALRVDLYPPRGDAANPAVYLFHRIQYAGVFEDGATIQGRPMLWLPLPHTPKRVNRERMTPDLFIRGVAPLVSLRSRRGTPLLGARVRLSEAQRAQVRPRITMGKLRRGADAKRGTLVTIPMFHGVPTTRINKRLNIREICAVARDSIPTLYAKHFKET